MGLGPEGHLPELSVRGWDMPDIGWFGAIWPDNQTRRLRQGLPGQPSIFVDHGCPIGWRPLLVLRDITQDEGHIFGCNGNVMGNE